MNVNKPITQEFIDAMRGGVPILDTITNECEVEQVTRNRFKIILTQGLNRQIRRMCEHLNYKVIKLKRTRIMNIQLDIPVGKYRDLTSIELDELNALLQDSEKTA